VKFAKFDLMFVWCGGREEEGGGWRSREGGRRRVE